MNAKKVYLEAWRNTRIYYNNRESNAPLIIDHLCDENVDAVYAATDSFRVRRDGEKNKRAELAADARGIVERLYGGITRERGFSRALDDKQAMIEVVRAGYVVRRGRWFNRGLDNLIHSTAVAYGVSANALPASIIWGE